MEVLQKLGVALGFATLAGLNLYLTVFATSMAIHNGWITLSPEYASLQVLGHPAVMIVAGALYFLEFFADKVPWVDSLWDLVHTVIRPLGGAFLALKTLGTPDPTYDVIVALLAGGVTLTVHGAKAGTRLVANASPEPFSNIALSLAEDVSVVGGLGVLDYSYQHNPWVALVVFGCVLLGLLYVAPKTFRFLRSKVWLLWQKLASPAAGRQEAVPGRVLPAEMDMRFHRLTKQAETVAWAAPCLTGRSKGGLPASCAGWIVGSHEAPERVYFVGQRGWRSLTRAMELAGCKAVLERKFLSEDLVIYHPASGTRQAFVFPRSRTALAEGLVARLQGQLEAGQGEVGVTPGRKEAARELVGS